MVHTFGKLLYPDTPFRTTCFRRNLAERVDIELNVSARPLCSSLMSIIDKIKKAQIHSLTASFRSQRPVV